MHTIALESISLACILQYFRECNLHYVLDVSCCDWQASDKQVIAWISLQACTIAKYGNLICYGDTLIMPSRHLGVCCCRLLGFHHHDLHACQSSHSSHLSGAFLLPGEEFRFYSQLGCPFTSRMYWQSSQDAVKYNCTYKLRFFHSLEPSSVYRGTLETFGSQSPQNVFETLQAFGNQTHS